VPAPSAFLLHKLLISTAVETTLLFAQVILGDR
jgi:hypothetical protein